MSVGPGCEKHRHDCNDDAAADDGEGVSDHDGHRRGADGQVINE